MDQDKHTYNFKLDFLYQSIAVYAVTLVIYLLARGWFVEKEFSIVWRDPILYLLSVITLISVLALVYYMMMKRRIRVHDEAIEFISSVRTRRVQRSRVTAVRIGREKSTSVFSGMRVVSIRLRDRRRPIRIRPYYFEHGKRLLDDLRTWAGPLVVESQGRRFPATR